MGIVFIMSFLLSSFIHVAYDNFYNFDNMAVPSITKSFVFSVDYCFYFILCAESATE